VKIELIRKTSVEEPIVQTIMMDALAHDKTSLLIQYRTYFELLSLNLTKKQSVDVFH